MGNEQPQTIEFYEQYLQTDYDPSIFISDLECYWPSQCDFILHRSGYSATKKDFHLNLVLRYYTLEQIDLSNRQAQIADYLKDKEDFLSFAQNLDFDRTTSIIKSLNIHFTKLVNTGDNGKVLKFIYEHSYYSINQEMIRLMIGTYSKNERPMADTFHSIIQSECTPLIEYIKSNIQVFIEYIFLTHSSFESEPEDTLITLLNNENINQKNKENILHKTKTKIVDLKSINPSLWPFSIKLRATSDTWENTISYHSHYNFDDVLVNYINDSLIRDVLSRQPINEKEIAKQDIQKFYDNLFENPEINDSTVASFADHCPFSYNSMSFASMSSARIKTLILKNIICLTTENFESLKQKANESNLKQLLLLQNVDEYIQSVHLFPLTGKDTAAMIRETKLRPDQKAVILNNLAPDEVSDSTANELATAILKEKLSPRQEITARPIQFTSDKSLSIALLTSPNASITVDEITQYLQMMGEPYSRILSPEGATLNENAANQNLLNFLKKSGQITEVIKEKDHFIIPPLDPLSEQPS